MLEVLSLRNPAQRPPPAHTYPTTIAIIPHSRVKRVLTTHSNYKRTFQPAPLRKEKKKKKMVASPTYTHALQLQDDLHIQSTSPSLPSPASSADPCVPTEPTVSTISQGPSLSPKSRLQVQSSSLTTSTFALDPRHHRQRALAHNSGTSHTRSQSLCSRSTSLSSSLIRNGKSETHLHNLVGNSSYFINKPTHQFNMLATEGTTTCFTLTSPLLPPSLANASATAPPPSSSSNSRKKPKTRLTLNALPRFPQPPSHTSQPHMSTGLGAPMNSHYTYTVQPSYQYSQHSYAQQQSNYLSAQQQLQFHQKDLIQQATRGSLPSHLLFPSSPRLIPMGSPGPVTPLTLEEAQGGYLFAGSPSNSSSMPFMQQRDMDKLAAIAAAQN